VRGWVRVRDGEAEHSPAAHRRQLLPIPKQREPHPAFVGDGQESAAVS
jgi:hypothetical protein